MPNPILAAADPDLQIYTRIGKIAAEWSWVEMLLAEMMGHFCSANPGAMYVVTQNVSNATLTGWLRTLIDIRVKDADTAKVISDLLTQVDETRAERNRIVHGTWRAADDPSTAWVQTFRWDRQEVARDELWSIHDLDDLVDTIQGLQLMLGNLGLKLGFLRPRNP